jgi:hypothetical protein
MMTVSRHFSQHQIRGVLKVGDIILPGSSRLPSFSQTGCVAHIDRMLAYLSPEDLNGLRFVFSVLCWSPRWLIHLVLLASKNNRWFPGFIGAGLRMLEIGTKGTVMSLYYANLTSQGYTGPKVFDAIGWDTAVNVQDKPDPNQ